MRMPRAPARSIHSSRGPACITAREIRAQMQAGYDLGVMGWVLWNASGRYPPDAFLPAGSPVTVAADDETRND